MKTILRLALILILGSTFSRAADNTNKPDEWSAGPLSVTHHSLSLPAGPLAYTATAGFMPMKDEKDSLKAKLFFTAYTRDGVADLSKRPIIFAFNGGPGSSSVWLHLGALGPERVVMTDSGESIPPPYRTTPNSYSWLDKADIVFIDPMLTGYTRPAGTTSAADFTGYSNDIRFVGDFIRLYLSRYRRWTSPKLLAGESYGTTRAAGLSSYLQETHGIYVNGIVLMSAVLSFNAADAGRDNDLPHALQLPTYAATAWYHKQSDPKYRTLQQLLKDAGDYAMNGYIHALLKGDQLPARERAEVAQKLHELTGLSKEYLESVNLRLNVGRFNKELLRKSGKTVGRFDSRITGSDFDNAGERYDYDPSYDLTVRGPFTNAYNDYVRRSLRFESDLSYEILTGRVWPWKYPENGYLNVAESLRSAMVRNPHLKVWVCSGYYDMATPWFTTEYVVHHMFLPEALRKNVSFTYYEAGHMMYLHMPSLKQLKGDYDRFMDGLLK